MNKLLHGILFLLIFPLTAYAQSGLLQEQIAQAELLVEAKVTAQSSFWNTEKTIIYTRNTLEVYKVIKGRLSSRQAEVISIGGRVGNTMMSTMGISPQVGETGLFMSGSNGHLLPQGFIRYDLLQNKAVAADGTVYQEADQQLYALLKQYSNTWQSFGEPFSKNSTPPATAGRTEALQIESFVPSTITGGTRSRLTINGSGFGERRGRGNVYFSNAETGGATLRPLFEDLGWFSSEAELISWSDTKIEVYVPAFAGTGPIAVLNDEQAETRTIDRLTVEYSVLTTPNFGMFPPRPMKPAVNASLINKSGQGGYTLFAPPSLYDNEQYLEAMSKALSAWRCNTGVNIDLARFQNETDTGPRGVCSIINTPVGNNLLYDVYFYYEACDIGSGEIWRLEDFQIVMDFDRLSRQNYDLETVVLQAIARSSQLGFVNTPSDLMFHRINPGERKTISATNRRVAEFVLSYSSTPKDCGPLPMQAVGSDRCQQVLLAPLARFSADVLALCDNGTVTFVNESRNASSLSWTFSGGSPATSTDNNPRVNYSSPGTYDVILVASNPGGTHTETRRGYITVGRSDELRLNLKDTVVCQGSTVRLDAGDFGAGTTYLWSNGATTRSIEVRHANTYSVRVSKNGCTVEGRARLSFANTPARAGVNISVCQGGSAQLNATGGVSYRWSPATGLSNPNIANPTVRPLATTVYYVEINTGGQCGIVRDSLLVSISEPPRISLPDTLTACGTGLLIIADSLTWNGNPQEGVSYQWNTGQSFPNIFVNREGKYWLTATSRGGCTVSDTTYVRFVDKITPVISASNLRICEGESVQLKASGGLFYSWKPAEGLSNPDIPDPVATPLRTTTYTVVVSTDPFDGCEPATTQITITVVPKPQLNLGREINSCDSVVVLDTRIPGARYLWSDGSTESTLRVRQSGTYSVQVFTEQCQQVLTDTVKVNIHRLNLGAYHSTCAQELTLDTGIEGASYLWSDGSTGKTLRVTRSGKYKVSVTLPGCDRTLTDSTIVLLPQLLLADGRDSIRSCQNEVQLDALGGLPAAGFPQVSFLWNDGSQSQTLRTTREGWYKVRMNLPQCNLSVTDSVYVSFFGVNLGNDIVTCADSILLDAGNPGAAYRWNDDAQSTGRFLSVNRSGSYAVTVTDTCGAVLSDTIYVQFNRIENVIGQNRKVLACQSTYLIDAGNAGIGAAYLWSDGSRGQTLSVSEEGLYTVVISDSCQNQINSSIYVVFSQPQLSLPDVLHTCADSLLIQSQIDSALATFRWSDGSTLPYLSVRTSGTYWLEARSNCGTILRDTVQVFFHSVAQSGFAYEISSTQPGTVSFRSEMQAGHGLSFLWNFGDGESSTEANPVHVFKQVGAFQVSLQVSSTHCGEAPAVQKVVNIIVASLPDEQAPARQVNVYPNPSAGGIFTLKHQLEAGTYQLKLSNMAGQSWSLSSFSENEVQVNLSELPRGLYLLEMTSDKVKVVKKIVIQ